MDAAAISLTLQLALSTTLLLLLFGLPLAFWLATGTSRLRHVVAAVVAVPLVLPPTVLGFYVLEATAPGSVLGDAWLAASGTPLPFSFAGLLVGSLLFNLPFAVRPFAAAFAAVDPRLWDAAATLGAGRWRCFARVGVPLAWPGIGAGAVLCFAHAIGEFGVVLMVGGNIPGVTRTLSIAIYDDVQAMRYDRAATTSLALLVTALLLLTAVQVLQGRRWAR
ncbi:MAG: molybdate ABC transporter permease subunit [Planctomycetota bacterium]